MIKEGQTQVKGRIQRTPGPVHFTMLFMVFGEKLDGTNPGDVISNAIVYFDDNATGTIQEDYLRELLTGMGGLQKKNNGGL
ncbi:myosin regulatory light chain 12B-like isoform X2 [Myotis myotis]|uniref:myosin regulatory light chain 12B-like isoform X2 n=1 Tax=Myotis myotis TaxID=51298 RepID=UPI00174B1DF3|nr:myosin regulatory light chain 12B-like isoform X2 [Myotis myotis]